MNKIPKVINVSWKTKDILDNQSPLILNGLRNVIDLNPDWDVIIHDNDDIDNYLKDNMSYNDYRLLEDCHIVVKSDMWRLLKLYNEGGGYMDLDRFCNIPFSEIITDDIQCVLPTCLDMDFSQDFMMSSPQNPIYIQTYKLSMQRRKMGHQNTYFLGPQTYMHAVSMVVMGEMIDSNPGVDMFASIRKRLDEIPFVKTYREYPPYDTIIYKHDESNFKMGNSDTQDWVQIKKNFYADFKLKHWTGEW